MFDLGKRAQAATELAVLGSIILIIFSFLINYSEKLNRQQSYIQQTFRTALREARNANHNASYTRVAFRRMPNVYTPMDLGQVQSFSSSANVLWADGLNEDEHGVSKYQLNEDVAIDIPYRETPDDGTIEIGQNQFINQVDSQVTFIKQETPGSIVTNKSLTAQDYLDATVDISGTTYSFTHSLGDRGKYYPGDNVLMRARNMQ